MNRLQAIATDQPVSFGRRRSVSAPPIFIPTQFLPLSPSLSASFSNSDTEIDIADGELSLGDVEGFSGISGIPQFDHEGSSNLALPLSQFSTSGPLFTSLQRQGPIPITLQREDSITSYTSNASGMLSDRGDSGGESAPRKKRQRKKTPAKLLSPEALATRRAQNIESAKRSRERKAQSYMMLQQEVVSLQSTTAALTAENDALRAQNARLMETSQDLASKVSSLIEENERLRRLESDHMATGGSSTVTGSPDPFAVRVAYPNQGQQAQQQQQQAQVAQQQQQQQQQAQSLQQLSHHNHPSPSSAQLPSPWQTSAPSNTVSPPPPRRQMSVKRSHSQSQSLSHIHHPSAPPQQPQPQPPQQTMASPPPSTLADPQAALQTLLIQAQQLQSTLAAAAQAAAAASGYGQSPMNNAGVVAASRSQEQDPQLDALARLLQSAQANQQQPQPPLNHHGAAHHNHHHSQQLSPAQLGLAPSPSALSAMTPDSSDSSSARRVATQALLDRVAEAMLMTDPNAAAELLGSVGLGGLVNLGDGVKMEDVALAEQRGMVAAGGMATGYEHGYSYYGD